MRIIFIGSVVFSQQALIRLIEMRANVVGVCTLEQSTVNADHSDLSSVCKAHDIPCVYAPDVNAAESMSWIADKQPDIIFCFGWSKLIRKKLLSIAPMGVVGFHPAALPANRGRHPIIWALVLGLKETASTFFLMDEGADSGDILAQERVEIRDEDNATTLYEKITQCALGQISCFVPKLASNTCPRSPQDDNRANVWRKRGKEDGRIDWRMSAHSVRNLVRGLARPYVGASFLYEGQEYIVWNTEIIANVPDNAEPGKVLEVSGAGPIIKCGEQGVRLLKMEPAFRPPCGEYL